MSDETGINVFHRLHDVYIKSVKKAGTLRMEYPAL